jgi:tyrosyl-tRNA synthetase
MDKTQELLTRSVSKIYPSREELEDILKKDTKLNVYQGFDATSPELHIGHMVGLRKLRQWQDLGHRVIFLIGDFTSTIGDPSGKDTARTPLTREEVLENAKTYKEQAGKILRFDGDNPAKVLFNSDWLGKMSATDFLNLSTQVTLGQVAERDLFQKRIKKGQEVYLNEFLYPIMQAYDSVHMDIDVEVGGEDQTFNMLMGRKLMRNLKKKEKFVMTTPLLTDAQGKKIGKTEGNAIALDDKPSDLFAKIMALGDDFIVNGFQYLTDVEMDQVRQIEESLKSGKNPITYKKKLAFEIVKQLNNHDKAHRAQEDFEKGGSQGPEKVVREKEGTLLSKIAISNGLASSNSEWKRLVSQRGIKVNGKTLNNPDEILSEQLTLQKGRNSLRIEPS